jgi:hypothetical protein
MSDTAPPEIHTPRKLTIWQQNLGKSLDTQSDLLHSLKLKHYDIATLKEPYIDFRGRSRATLHWHVLYPTLHSHSERITQAVTLVNTRLPTDTWTQIPINSSDIVGLQLHGDFGTIWLINIYNDGDHNKVLQALSKHMHDPTARSYPARPLHYIWMGDFNHQSLLWDEERNEHLFTPHAL